MKTEKQREHYDSVGELYYQARQSKRHLLYKDLLWSHFFHGKKHIGHDGLKLLEPMCGNADGKEIVEKYLGITVDYEGFDYSAQFIKRLREWQPNLNVYIQDITRFAPNKEYDMIILVGGLHHIPAFVNEVLPRLNEALRDGGYFVSFEATHNNFIFQKMRERIYTKNSVFENETEEAFEYNKLHRMFRKNNFILVDELHAGLLSYILYYNPEAFPWLNIGGATLVKLLFRLDGLFMRNLIGRKLSFATMSLWKKNA